MRRIISKLLFVAMLLVGVSAFAVPAYPGLVKLSQPNGEEISVYIFGDERINWIESQDGYTLMYNKQGYLEYAMLNENEDLVPSGVMARNADLRSNADNTFLYSISKKLRFSQAQMQTKLSLTKAMYHGTKLAPNGKTTGIRKVLVIMVQYSDKSFTYSKANFESMFNDMNYSSGSLRKYFSDNSYGKLDMQCVIEGPITLPQTRAYYGGNTPYQDNNAKQMIIDACNAVDSVIDFSQYDNNNDGKVDGVHVIYAGGGEADGGPANSVWPHESHLTTSLVLDGVQIYSYSCACECQGGDNGSITGIGVHVHEMGHVLGLPDYYDTDYATNGISKTFGGLDVMDAGNYNNDGHTPPLYNAYSKVLLGWATPYVIDSNMVMDITAIPTTDSALVFRINTPTPGEYFYLENKDFLGWNAYMHYSLINYRNYSGESSGMFMIHVDESSNAYGWSDNCLNCYSSRNSLQVRSADGVFNGYESSISYSYSNMANMFYPGSSHVTSLSDSTTNSLRSWDGYPSGVRISDITYNSSNNYITFKINGGSSYGVGVKTLQATLTDSTTAILKGTITASTLGTATTEAGFVISSVPYPRISDGKHIATLLDTISVSIDTLRRGIRYYYRAYGINTNGVTYGEQYSILTPSTNITNNTIVDSTFAACETGETPTIVATVPQGGSGVYEYRWLQSSDNSIWSVTTSNSGNQNYTPSTLTTPTYFCRVVTSADKVDTSASVFVGIVPPTVAGQLTALKDSIGVGRSTGDITLSGNTGSINTWQRKKNSSSWASLSGTGLLNVFSETLQDEGTYQYRVVVQNGACPSKTTDAIKIVVSSLIGLDDVENVNREFTVYPNPSNGSFTLVANDKEATIDVKVIDVLGKTIFARQNLSGRAQIDLSSIERGTYILMITKDKTLIGKKVLILK